MRKSLLLGATLVALFAACGEDSEQPEDDGDSDATSTSSTSSTGGSGPGSGGFGPGPSSGGSGPGGAGGSSGPGGSGGIGGTGGSGIGGTGGSGIGGTGGIGTGGTGGIGTGGMGGIGTGGTGGSGTGGTGGTGGGMNSCLDAEDCSLNGSQICDQPSQSCLAPQCTSTNPTCSNVNDVCLIQFPNSNNGACYPGCTPFSGTCGSGQECVDLTGEGSLGACLYTGTNTLGQPCTGHDINTDCTVGHVCVDAGSGDECIQQCNYWGSSASCTDPGQSCFFVGLCIDTPTFVDPASVGALCGSGAQAGDFCGVSGDRVLGSCQTNVSLQLECVAFCRMAFSDCSLNETCTPFGPPYDAFGACL